MIIKSKYFVLLTFLLGVALGGAWQFKKSIQDRNNTSKTSPVRSGDGKYTNPLLLCGIDSSESNKDYLQLQTQIEEIISQAKDNQVDSVSIYFRNFSKGVAFSINPQARYIPASLNKVPLMIKVYEKIKEDPAFINKKIIRTDLNDANLMQIISPSTTMKTFAQYSIEDAVKLMIIHSDNNAYNAITSIIKYDDYQDMFNKLNIPTDYETGITAEEYSYFFRVLYNSTVLSKDLSEKSLKLLTQTKYDKALKAGVPEGVKIAHKFGTSGQVDKKGRPIDRQLHDCGIVYASSNQYLLCVMSRGNVEVGQLEKTIAEISKTTYDYQEK